MVDSTQIWELLDERIDMWVAVNGKGWIGMLLWPKLGYMTRTPFVVMGGFWEAAQRFRQPQQDIPGQWTCSLCGQERVWPTKIDAFGVEIRNIMILFLLVQSLVQLVELHKECLPRIRLSGEMDARTRYLVTMCLLWFRRGSLQLKMLGLAMLFRHHGCVSIL